MFTLWKNRRRECLLKQAQGQKCSHSFHLFSFYLKSNAENQILQSHTDQNKKQKKGTITEGLTFHRHPSEPTSHPCVSILRVCWCVLCNPDVYRPPLHNQLLCFRKLFFLHFSENLNIFSLLKIQEKQNKTSSRYLLITKHLMLKSKCFWQQQHTSHLMKRKSNVPTNVVFTGHGLHVSGKVKVGSSWLHCASALSLSLSLYLSLSLSWSSKCSKTEL